MNFCPDCGVKRIQEAKYCHNCGYSFLKMTNPETKKVFTTEEVLNDPRFKEMASKFNTWEGLDAAKSFLSLPYTLFKIFTDDKYDFDSLETAQRKWITKYINELQYPIGSPYNENLSSFKEKILELNREQSKILIEQLQKAVSNKEFFKNMAIEGAKVAINPKKKRT